MLPASRRRRATRSLLATLLALAALVPTSGGASASAPHHVTAPPGAPPTAAWLVLDADTGLVLGASNARTRLRVASTFKLLTALVVRARVPLTDAVPISARAQAMPALKISVKAGQRWAANDLLHSMMLASANDAAVALAERAGGGTLAGFDRVLASAARSLGLADHPVLHDPAGLDDEFSFEGGNLMSARDLAIVARAYLADPVLARVSTTTAYGFRGGDGRSHDVVSHNGFLGAYPGAVGLKTGYTRLAGSSLVAAARRGGRTLVAVVINSANTIAMASGLLDRGFALAPSGEPTDDRLPSPPAAGTVGAPARPAPAAAPTMKRATPVRRVGGGSSDPAVALGLLGAVLAVLVLVRRRQVVLARAAATRQARRRPPGPPRR